MGLTRLYFLAAVGTLVNIITSVDPSESYLGLDIPVTVYYPRVAVSQSCSDSPPLITVVGKYGEVGTEEVE